MKKTERSRATQKSVQHWLCIQ